VEQLSSIDAAFIEAETPNLPMHVSSVSVYDPSTAPQGVVRFKDIMALYEDAIYDVPMLRRRLVQVPGNMDFPYWIEDPDFDIEFHVRHIALPQPGDWRQLYIQLARLHSRGLDMQRPLWEIYVIEGLNNLDGIPAGSFAIMQKLHHAAVDGDSVQRMFLAMHEMDPKAPARSSHRSQPLIRETRPGTLPLLLKSYQRSLVRPFKLSKALARTIGGRRRVDAARKAGELGEPVESPKSRFNGDISPHRVVTDAQFDFDELKALRHAVPGATVNDLAIAVIAGALRLYLEDKGEPVDQPLVTQIPVNIRTESQRSEHGNKITYFNVSSCSHIADPLERLQGIHQSTAAGKRELEIVGDSVNEDMADALGPHVTKAIFRLMENTGRIQALTNLMPGGPNFAFSNMPGPPVPMYLCGAELVWGIGLGPLMPNMGLFITAYSGLGRFVFGVTACRSMMPDPEFFQQCLYDAYAEVKAALQGPARKNAPKKRRKTAK
jgi:WS/DGAT/MGAT family acyltransferase